MYRLISDTETPSWEGRTQCQNGDVLRIWKEYYKGQMDEENERSRERERDRRVDDEERVNLDVDSISKEEVWGNMKNGKAVGPEA